MPTELKLQNAEEFLKAISATPLGDPTVGPGLPGATIAADQSFAGQKLSVNVHGALSLNAFNSPDDKDEDGILGDAPADLPIDALPPQIPLASDAAYVKYRAEAGIKAAVSGQTLGSLGFAIEGGFDVILTDYHKHGRGEPTRDALRSDLKKLRTSLLASDVLELGTGEAVSQQVVGRLSAAVEVSWSDVFMGPVGPLSRLAGGAAVLIKVSAGATLKASVSLRDEFLLVFSRVDTGRVRVGLRKARTREAAVALDLGVSVEFADPQQIEGILGDALEGVIGAPLDQVDRILAKATLADLSEAERGIANFLLDRFGLDRAVATLDTIRQRISDIRNRIKDTISDIARAKVALGFAYEYRRMRQDTTVAQCTVTDARLTAHHPDLVRGKFDALFAEAERGENGSKLEHYLYQTKIKSVRSWGFSLSIGKWIAIGSRDTKTLQRVDRHSASGRIQRAFVGTRGYRETGDDQDRWSGDLSASMPAYSRAPVPLVSEFEAGVAFSWFEPTRKLDDKTISTWLDHGVLWGAIREGDTARVRETLAAGLKQKCAMGAQLTFPHEAFSIMRRRISSANPKEIGVGLGAAMPWSEVAGRHSVTLRRKLYGPLWEFYLSKPEHEHRVGRDFAIAARKHLADQGFEDLASMEQLYAGSSRPHDGNVFCGLIDLNPSTFQNCRDFFNGVRRLDAGVLSAEPDNGVMARIFEEMENLWRQSHHVRGVGAYLLEIARITGVLKHVTQSMSVTVGVGTASEQVFVVGS